MPDTSNNRWWLLLILSFGLLLITLDNSILYTALPTLARELGADQGELLWIINAYPLVMAGLLLGSGSLGDRIGHRRMFLVGLVVFGVASLCAAFAPTPAVLIAARAVLAIGAAAMMPATLALIRVTFHDERERNMAFALWGMLAIVGAALGPIIGGFLVAKFWWGAAFLINVPVVVLAFIGTLIFAPKVAPNRASHWDVVSSAQAMIALSALVVAIKEAALGERLSIAVAAALIMGIAACVFVRRQRKLAYPLLDFAVFSNPALISGVVAASFSLFGIAGMQLATSQRVQLVDGYSPLEAGYLVSIIALASIPLSLIGGAFLHRIGLRILIAGGLGLCTLAALITAYGVTAGDGWLIFGLVVMGCGIGAALSVASVAILSNAPAHRAGMAGAVEEVSYELGALFAVAILGSLMSALYTAGAAFPQGTPEVAGESLMAARVVADSLGAQGEAVFAEAARAFDRAYAIVLYVIAGVLGLGAAMTFVLLRSYGPGSAASMYDSH